MASKKKAAKKVAKKSAVKKTAKKVTAKKAVKAAKKPAKKAVKKATPKKTVAIKAVTDSTGVVTLKSVDEADSTTEGSTATVTPSLDKETGVLTMVPSGDK